MPADLLGVAVLADLGHDLHRIVLENGAIAHRFALRLPLLASTRFQPTVDQGVIRRPNRDIKITSGEGQTVLGMIQTDRRHQQPQHRRPPDQQQRRGDRHQHEDVIFTESGASLPSAGPGPRLSGCPSNGLQWLVPVNGAGVGGYFRRTYGVGWIGTAEVNELICSVMRPDGG